MKKNILSKLYFLFILILAFLIRIYKLGDKPFSGDEARIIIKTTWILKGLWNLFQGNFSKENLSSFYGIFSHTHPPLEIIFPLPFMIFRINEFWVRLPYAMLGLGIIIFVYYFIKKEISTKIAILSMPIIAFSPFLIGWGRNADYSLVHIFLSGILVYFLYRFTKFHQNKDFYFFIIILSIAFLTHIDFIVILPMALFYLMPALDKISGKIKFRGLLIFLFTVGVFYLSWILISFFYLFGYLGLRYLFFYRVKMIGSFSLTFKYFITNFIFDINILPWLIFLPFSLRNFKKDKLVQILTVFCLSYIIYFFMIRSTLPYLFNIYLPLVFLGLIGIKKIKFKLCLPLFIFWSLTSLLLSIYFLNGGTYPTGAVWGFNGTKKTDLKEAGAIIRACLNKDEKYLSNEDGYMTDFYFNRKYPKERENNNFQDILDNRDILNIKAVFFTDQFLEQNSQIKFFLEKESKQMIELRDKEKVYLFKDCSPPKISNIINNFFDNNYGNFNTIIDFKR